MKNFFHPSSFRLHPLFFMEPAIDKMIIDHADSLHEGVHDRTADKSKPPLLEILRQSIALWTRGRDVRRALPAIDNGGAFHELPDIAIKRSKLVLDRHEGPGVTHGSFNF